MGPNILIIEVNMIDSKLSSINGGVKGLGRQRQATSTSLAP